jgi:hypothetical protein
MTDPQIATAADYSDAMFTARRAKHGLVLLVLLMLLAQLGIFFLARYTTYVVPTESSATTQPARWVDLLQYVVSLTDFLGVVLTIVLSLVLLLIVNIMLIGRLIGVARTTSAYIWCLLLLVLLFPWQAFLSTTAFKWPGVLYTWDELLAFAKFQNEMTPFAILKWARFVGWPVVAVIIVLLIQIKSNRGLRQAFGEVEPDIHTS